VIDDLTIVTTIGIIAIITATIVVMTDLMIAATTTAATTAVMNAATTAVMNAATTAVIAATTTMIATTTITFVRSQLLHHHQKQAIPMVCSRMPTDRSTSSSVAAKQPRAIGSSGRTQGRSTKSTPKLHNPRVG
jgi:cell division protein FtsW (lipid II flippase)